MTEPTLEELQRQKLKLEIAQYAKDEEFLSMMGAVGLGALVALVFGGFALWVFS